MLGVDPKTYMWWERDEREPYVHQYPAIIAFLGYESWANPTCLAEQLVAARRRRGLSIRQAAATLGVDEGTFGRWETGAWRPQQRSQGYVDAFLLQGKEPLISLASDPTNSNRTAPLTPEA